MYNPKKSFKSIHRKIVLDITSYIGHLRRILKETLTKEIEH